MQKITPFLWFDNQAEAAMNFYMSIFDDAKVLDVSRYPEGSPGPAGQVMTAVFELCGQQIVILNGGPTFKLNEAFSFTVSCENQAEVDNYWTKLTSGGGEESQCGWLKDRFGLSWQIVPTLLPKLMTDPDPEKSSRVMQAMLKMKKIDTAALQVAYDGN